MSAVPVWIQVLQALLTPAIAVGVATIAFLQWRTAHQKVVLDLFDRRLNVYSKARRALSAISGSGRVTDESDRLLLEAENEAAFLFGKDIKEYFRELWFLCVRYRGQQGDDHRVGPHFPETHQALMTAVGEFYTNGADRFAPYMRMDQRRVPTLNEWVAERNRIHLSYADEKKK